MKDEQMKDIIIDSLDTCLELKHIAVSDKLRKKTLEKIEETKKQSASYGAATIENLEIKKNTDGQGTKGKVTSLQDSLKKQSRSRLQLAANIAAATVIIVVGVSILRMGIGVGIKKDTAFKSNTADFIASESAESVYQSKGEEGSATGGTNEGFLMDGRNDAADKSTVASEKLPEPEYSNSIDIDQVETTVKSDVTFIPEATDEEMRTASEVETDVSDQSLDAIAKGQNGLELISFEEICNISLNDVNEIIFRDISDSKDIVITDRKRIEQIFDCMDETEYSLIGTNIRDPKGWDFVIELKGNDEAYTVWIGEYIIIEDTSDNGEGAFSYEVGNLATLYDELMRFYDQIKE